MMRCKNQVKPLGKGRKALRRGLSNRQRLIAEGTSRKLDDADLTEAWEIFQDLTGYSEKEILDMVSNTQPKPLTFIQKFQLVRYKTWSIFKAFWKVIFFIIGLGAATVTTLSYFGISPK